MVFADSAVGYEPRRAGEIWLAALIATDTRSPCRSAAAVNERSFGSRNDRRSALLAVGLRVKELRLEGGLTQAELAAASGVNRAALSRIETGADIGASKIPALARALGTDPSRLFVQTADVTNSPDNRSSLLFKIDRTVGSPGRGSGSISSRSGCAFCSP